MGNSAASSAGAAPQPKPLASLTPQLASQSAASERRQLAPTKTSRQASSRRSAQRFASRLSPEDARWVRNIDVMVSTAALSQERSKSRNMDVAVSAAALKQECVVAKGHAAQRGLGPEDDEDSTCTLDDSVDHYGSPVSDMSSDASFEVIEHLYSDESVESTGRLQSCESFLGLPKEDEAAVRRTAVALPIARRRRPLAGSF